MKEEGREKVSKLSATFPVSHCDYSTDTIPTRSIPWWNWMCVFLPSASLHIHSFLSQSLQVQSCSKNGRGVLLASCYRIFSLRFTTFATITFSLPLLLSLFNDEGSWFIHKLRPSESCYVCNVVLCTAAKTSPRLGIWVWWYVCVGGKCVRNKVKVNCCSHHRHYSVEAGPLDGVGIHMTYIVN